MISVDGCFCEYSVMSAATADDRHGARPPAVSMATFLGDSQAFIVVVAIRDGVDLDDAQVCGQRTEGVSDAAWGSRPQHYHSRNGHQHPDGSGQNQTGKIPWLDDVFCTRYLGNFVPLL